MQFGHGLALNSVDFRGLGAVRRRKAPKSAVYSVRMYVGIVLLSEFGHGLAPNSVDFSGRGVEKYGKAPRKSVVLAQFSTIECDPTYIVRTYVLIAVDQVHAIKHHP